MGWHGPISLVLIIQLSKTGSMSLILSPEMINLAECPVYHFFYIFEGVVDYTPFSITCTRLMAVISFVDPALSYVLMA